MSRTYEGAFPVAVGTPGLDALRTELVAPEFNVEWASQSCISAITTNKFEGQLRKQGDTVNIPVLPTITWNDYVIGKATEPQKYEPTMVQLKIQRAKQISIQSEMLQELQAMFKGSARAFAEWAVKTNVQALCTTFFADVYDDCHAKNTGAAAGDISGNIGLGTAAAPITVDSGDDAMALLANMRTVLSEFFVDEGSRWVVAPSMLCNYLMRSNVANVAWIGGGSSVYKNGIVTKSPLAGFDIYENNLIYCPSTGVFAIPFGHKQAIAFAQQLVKERTIELENNILGKRWEMVQVYDWKVVQSKGLGTAYVKFA